MIMNTDYNEIKDRFEIFRSSSPQRPVEMFTAKKMAGSLHGLAVLDLACGYGLYMREAVNSGASHVIGVDISSEMIALAKTYQYDDSASVDFIISDVCDLGIIGSFDIIIAAWLFNYADSIEKLKKMLQVAAANLKPTGKLVAFTQSPSFNLTKGDFEKYGVKVLHQKFNENGYTFSAQFVTEPPIDFSGYSWSIDIYQQAISEAGFKHSQWQKLIISDEQKAAYPVGFWDELCENSFQTGLICTF